MCRSTCTTPSLPISTPGIASMKRVSAFWPSARIRVSASMVSSSPVGCGQPVSSSSIFSTVKLVCSIRLMVSSQRTTMPSSSASSTSKSWAGICSRVRR